MKEKCEIRIYDKNFNWLNVSVLAESVQVARELYGPGMIEMHIHPDKPGAAELTRRGNIVVINGDGHKSGIIRSFRIDENRAESRLIIHAETGNGMTRQRITVPPTKTQDSNALGWDKISGNAETILKHYAARNMTNAFDTKRNIPNLIIASNLNRGKVFPWKSRYAVLSDELSNIGSYAETGFEIRADTADKRWVFDVIEGTDRTKKQSAVSPVTFKMEFQNVDGYSYTEDFTNYRSAGYAGGAGEEENRLVYTLGAESAGIERWEAFLDCGNARDIDELKYYGEQKLNEYKESKTVEVKALPRVFIFEEDYFLGDLVSVYISRLGIEMETRITSVKEIWERGSGYRNEIRFGGKLANIFTILNRREEVY